MTTSAHLAFGLLLCCAVIPACDGQSDSASRVTPPRVEAAATADSESPSRDELVADEPSEASTALAVVSAKTPVLLPTYTILEETITDTPGKAMVRQELLVPQGSENELRALLLELYRQAYQRKFKHHAHATVVGLYAYRTEGHYRSGAGQWIAMLLMSPFDAEPQITMNHDALSTESAPAVERHGLTEQQRREVFAALVLAKDRAQQEADKAFPPDAWGRDGFEQWDKRCKKLTAQYVAEAARKYGLREEQMDDISSEGMRANWPLPEHR